MGNPITLSGTRIITVSGRIGAGSTSLAKNIAKELGWRHVEGGDIFWEAIRKRMNISNKDTKLRSDDEDLLFEEKQKEMLKNEQHLVLESKLAGFCAQGIADVFKVVVLCDDVNGVDQAEIRIDRLVNREHVSVDDAKAEVFEREANDLAKWRKLYAKEDETWVYWDKKYYDLVINTFSHNQEESLASVLKVVGYR